MKQFCFEKIQDGKTSQLNLLQLAADGIYSIGLPGDGYADWAKAIAALAGKASLTAESIRLTLEDTKRLSLARTGDGWICNETDRVDSILTTQNAAAKQLLSRLEQLFLPVFEMDAALRGDFMPLQAPLLDRLPKQVGLQDAAFAAELISCLRGENQLHQSFAAYQLTGQLDAASYHLQQMTRFQYRFAGLEQIWDLHTGKKLSYQALPPEVQFAAAISLALCQKERLSPVWVLYPAFSSDGGKLTAENCGAVRSYFYRLAKSSG